VQYTQNGSMQGIKKRTQYGNSLPQFEFAYMYLLADVCACVSDESALAVYLYTTYGILKIFFVRNFFDFCGHKSLLSVYS